MSIRLLRLPGYRKEEGSATHRNDTDLYRGRSHIAAVTPRYSRAFILGSMMIGAVALMGLLVPLVSPYSPDQVIAGARLLPPSPAHPFGTDPLGRDLLVRVAWGAHIAAQTSFFSVGISLLIGLAVGSVAGYYSGWVDQLVSRIMDGWLALPGILVAVIIVARLGASLENLILALGLMGIPGFYRLVRNAVLGARCMPFTEAAVALGATDGRVILKHVLPNILSPVIVLTSSRLGTMLLTGSSLSFIGLGAQPPLPEWGALLAAGRSYLDTAWWLGVFPGLATTMAVVGFNLLGDGLRDLQDPRMRRHFNHIE